MTDAQWILAKKEVDSWSPDFERVVAKYDRERPGAVNSSESGKYQRIEITMPDVFGNKATLLVYQSKRDGVKFSKYCLFRQDRAIVYCRDLLDKQEKDDEFEKTVRGILS